MPPSAAQLDQAKATQSHLPAAQQIILQPEDLPDTMQGSSVQPLAKIKDDTATSGSSPSTKDTANEAACVRNKRSSTKTGDPTPEVAQQLRFPWKLHLLLERCEYENVSSVAASGGGGIPRDPPIGWLPDGKSFKVHDKERFIKEVMPSFFGTQSFKTFQRNLNLWGFTRVSKGPLKDVCSHPLFLKGFPALCRSMKRIVIKGTGRGNRAPLGGVDVSSVQAVVAAAAIQQQQAQVKAQLQARAEVQAQLSSPQVQVGANDHLGLQNHQQQPQVQQQQHYFFDGSIHATPIRSEQKLTGLPSQQATAASAPTSATTTVMWPNKMDFNNNASVIPQPQSIQPQQQPNSNLQQSLQQLGSIIEQLKGNSNNTNVNANGFMINNNVNAFAGAQPDATNPMAVMSSQQEQQFQQQQQLQQQQLQQQQQQIPNRITPTPLPTTAQIQQQQQQMFNQNSIAASVPTPTQDLVTLLLQRNLQQQVQDLQSQQQLQIQQPQQQQGQLQLPGSIFPSPLQQQQSTLNQQYQQAISTVATMNQQNQQLLQPNPINNINQQQPVAAVPSSTPWNEQQQQQQLLQLLLQQGISS